MSLVNKYNESRGRMSIVSAKLMVPIILKATRNPKTIADVGSGDGSFARCFVSSGCKVDTFDSQISKGSTKHYQCDLSSGVVPDTKTKYDLAVSLEFAEHIPESSACALVESMCRMSDIVVFAAAIPLIGGNGHLNEQWPSYWINKFEQFKMFPYDCLRPLLWSVKEIAPWYKQDTIVFATRQKAKELGFIESSQPFDIVHPDVWSKIGIMGYMDRFPLLSRAAIACCFGLIAIALIKLMIKFFS